MEKQKELTIAVRDGDEVKIDGFRRAVVEKVNALAAEHGIGAVNLRLATRFVEERIDDRETINLDEVSIPASNNLITNIPVEGPVEKLPLDLHASDTNMG